jgi:predicted transcriptional regulator
MAAHSLENEFNEYWSKLSVIEKQSLLTVAKNYVELKGETTIDIDAYNQEIDEAVVRVEAGEFFTHEEVLKRSKEW